MHNLHDLLRRGQTLHDLSADRARLDSRHELLDDPEIDVCLKKCQTHLAQSGVHVLLGQFAVGGQSVEYGVQLALKVLEHCLMPTPVNSRMGRPGGRPT